MYKVIIVDDEYFAAKLLEKYIADYIGDFFVAEIFQDATEVVQYFAAGNRADVVMTDIRMRKMSGVQLAKYIHTMRIDTEIIFVSAYADFEYAKEAINYNVYGYLLKAIDIDELKQMMGGLKQKLDSKNQELGEDTELLKGLFAENLIMGKFQNAEQLQSEFEKCGYRCGYAHAECALLEISFGADCGYDRLVDLEGMEKIEASLVGVTKCVTGKEDVSCAAHFKNLFYITIIDQELLVNRSELEQEISEIFSMKTEIQLLLSEKLPYFIQNQVRELSFLDQNDNETVEEASGRDTVIREAVDYINQNIGKDLSRELIANKVGLSPAYFGRVFKEIMKVSYSDYIFSVRMKRAEELLKKGIKTTDVCTQIGVLDERQFRRSFKLYSHMSPAEYRKKHRTGDK